MMDLVKLVLLTLWLALSIGATLENMDRRRFGHAGFSAVLAIFILLFMLRLL